jgi:acetyl esterase/lipase
VVNHAAEYGIDPRRVVVTGGSAGGHLALLTAFGSPGFESACPEAGREEPQARAVINYYGATDKAVRLHEALTAKGVANQLLTVRGGTHGRHTWTDSDTLHAQQAIERFLRRHHILTAALR